MINKSLINFEEDKIKYEKELNNALNEDKLNVEKAFKNNLKLYLFEANKMLKDTFALSLSPYIQTEGYNGLYQKGGIEIHLKSKEEYYNELDNLLSSNVYLSADNQKKALINNAIYILKKYYEDSLK